MNIIFPRILLQDVPYISFLFIKNGHFSKNFYYNKVDKKNKDN